MTAPDRTNRPSSRRLTAAGVADLFVPGLGHAFVGRPRAAALFFIPFGLAILGLLWLFVTGGFTGIVAWVVTPGVLPLLIGANVAFAIWRIVAALDAARGTANPKLAFGVIVPAAFLFVLVPHLWLGSTLAATSDFLDSTFANGPEVSEEPDDTPPPGWTYAPDPEETDAASLDPSFTLDPNITPGPTGTPRPPMTSGTGNLPPLNVTVPWQRPGAVPWGNDGRFDMLLLGSDAGPDRWSRRMDVMLLVEIDVSTGKVAMIGLPRNLYNAPFPAGPARDAVSCGCFKDLLNALYVEATVRHPDRWPGTGAVAGIGAVRSVVSEITGRPVDAVVVADLWGMIKVVDAMGGIDIDIPYSVHDNNYPDPVYGHIEMSLPAGEQHLDGRHALFYARSRHQDSDYGRMARQQTLLLAIRDQIGPSTILNAPDLFNAAKGFTWTDLPRSSLPNLVELFGKAAHASVKQLRIVPPTYPEYLTTSELTKIRNAVAALLGLPAPPTPSPSVAPTGTAPAPTPSHTPGPVPTDTPKPTETPPPPTETPAPT
ncbi:MAG TPA: LCP family protein [Candidatus Limnocylindrales bacterium]|nr:LCP family protein [Candidatus Limnocylindrales bacterium]